MSPVPWHIATPIVFRYLRAAHVDGFFETGALRLSTVRRFRRHKDEQRGDGMEGYWYLVHRNHEGDGQSLTSWMQDTNEAYILSTSMRYRPELAKAFECDSYIRIDRTTPFARAVATKITGLLSGAEGPCVYQDHRIIEHDLGPLDPADIMSSDNPSEVDSETLTRLVNEKVGYRSLFLKESTYGAQVEYRFVWVTSPVAGDYLDIKVPEAIEFCSRPNILTE